VVASDRKAAEGRRTPRREAFTDCSRTARSVLECASPLAFWAGGRDARGDAKRFHLFDDRYYDWLLAEGEKWLRPIAKRRRAAALQDAKRSPAAHELREASWSAPVLWRFGPAGGTRGATRNDFAVSTTDITIGSWLRAKSGCVRSQSGGGLAHSKTRSVHRLLTNCAKRFGVRQSSGALGRRAGRAGRRETISPFRQ